MKIYCKGNRRILMIDFHKEELKLSFCVVWGVGGALCEIHFQLLILWTNFLAGSLLTFFPFSYLFLIFPILRPHPPGNISLLPRYANIWYYSRVSIDLKEKAWTSVTVEICHLWRDNGNESELFQSVAPGKLLLYSNENLFPLLVNLRISKRIAWINCVMV